MIKKKHKLREYPLFPLMYWPAELELFVTSHFHADVALQSTRAYSGSSKELATEMRDFIFLNLYCCIALICIFLHPQQTPEKVCSSMKPLMV